MQVAEFICEIFTYAKLKAEMCQDTPNERNGRHHDEMLSLWVSGTGERLQSAEMTTEELWILSYSI